MIAEHNKNDWHGHERIVLGAQLGLGSERGHPPGDFLVAIMHRRGKKGPPRAAGIFTEARQLLAAANDFFCTICNLIACPHWIPLSQASLKPGV